MDSAVRVAVLAALRSVVDPEVGLDVVAMGLIYGIEVSAKGIDVRMTLTSAQCPLGGVLFGQAKEAVEGVAGGRSVRVIADFEPPWTPDRISEEGRRALRS